MKISVRTAPEIQTKSWSGGTTTQLYIHPEASEYQKLDFEFRLSTSTIDTDVAEFSILPGVQRYLMILDGTIKINHSGRQPKILKKFDQDEFMGDWHTTSLGIANDFNLMTKQPFHGELKALYLETNTSKEIKIRSQIFYTGIFIYKGLAIIETDKDCIHMNKGDFAGLFAGENYVIKVKSLEKTEIVLALISKI